MKIEYIQSYAHPDHVNLLFNLTEPTKNTLRTFIGTFVMEGQRVEMNEEWLYEVPVNPPSRVSILASLVESRETGEWSVFMDEVYKGEDDEMYRFEDSPYKLHSRLFLFDLNPGQENLDDVTIRAFFTVPFPKEKTNASSPPSEG